MTISIDKLKGPPEEILAAVRRRHPEIISILTRVRTRIPYTKRQVSEYQGAALYALGAQYNKPDAKILEIGTAWGYSAACLASAAPQARLTTLNPKAKEYPLAVKYLSYWPNVQVLNVKSWDYVEQTTDTYDFIFVDGDHGQVRRDLVWWEFLNPGGLLLFHDYAPDGSWRPCQPVYDAVNEFARDDLKRPLDVLIEDDRGVGLAGFYKEPSPFDFLRSPGGNEGVLGIDKEVDFING